ncbi:MAG: imidazolonepropionase [Gemmatimonadaceae bacterium]|nr:imidazolonepropionase [Gemmatimonadaceae bacterium]
MSATRLLTNIGALVTVPGKGAVRGGAMGELSVTHDAAVAITNGHVSWCGSRSDWQGTAHDEVDLGGAAVVPGLVDPHTHVVWGGDRLADFEARASGVAYETILAGGGGIRHTVGETSRATTEALVGSATQRLQRMMRAGATTIEVKSGYGAGWEDECRELEVVRRLRSLVPARLEATMLFHLPPRDAAERAAYLHAATNEWIPQLASDGSASAVDIFIEREAFSVADAGQVLRAARRAGLSCKAHTDQFHALGGTELAIAHGALSVDHLESSGPDQVAALAAGNTVGVVLPGVSLHLGLPAAPGRALVDSGAIVAVGTDCNPGSSPLFSMAMAMALGVRLNGLSPAESLTACTANAAAALGLPDVGRIAPGMCADLLVLRSADWRDLPYTLGDDVVQRVFIAGTELS